MEEKVFYRRNLPHWQPPGATLFVTWRLRDSLPKRALLMLKEKEHLREGERFVLADRELDKASAGPLWLKDARIASLVVETMRHGERELRLFALHAFVVMANHVHVLLTPNGPLQRITRGIKRKTAADANVILGRRGLPFWQDESFDRWCRDETEFARIKQYIEWNPVRAGLVKSPEDWPWSSASRGTGL